MQTIDVNIIEITQINVIIKKKIVSLITKSLVTKKILSAILGWKKQLQYNDKYKI